MYFDSKHTNQTCIFLRLTPFQTLKLLQLILIYESMGCWDMSGRPQLANQHVQMRYITLSTNSPQSFPSELLPTKGTRLTVHEWEGNMPVNLSNTQVWSHLCGTSRQWVEHSLSKWRVNWSYRAWLKFPQRKSRNGWSPQRQHTKEKKEKKRKEKVLGISPQCLYWTFTQKGHEMDSQAVKSRLHIKHQISFAVYRAKMWANEAKLTLPHPHTQTRTTNSSQLPVYKPPDYMHS